MCISLSAISRIRIRSSAWCRSKFTDDMWIGNPHPFASSMLCLWSSFIITTAALARVLFYGRDRATERLGTSSIVEMAKSAMSTSSAFASPQSGGGLKMLMRSQSDVERQKRMVLFCEILSVQGSLFCNLKLKTIAHALNKHYSLMFIG